MHEPGHQWEKIKLEGAYDRNKPKTGEAYAKALADLTPKITAYNSLHGTEIGGENITRYVEQENGEWFLFVDVTPEALIRKGQTSEGKIAADALKALRFNPGEGQKDLKRHYEDQGLIFDTTPRPSAALKPATHELVIANDGGWSAVPIDSPKRKNRIIQDAVTGGWIMIDENNPYADPIPIGDAPDPVNERPTGKDIELIAVEELEDKSKLEFWRVGNSIKEYRSSPQNTVDPGKDFHKVEGGVFYKTSPNRYDFVADPGEPFTPSKSRAIPELGGRMIQTSPNQWQFVRDSYEPGVVQDPLTGRFFSQNASGDWRELDYRADPGVVQIGDREFLQQHTGDLRELDRQFDPGVIRDPSGLTLIQQPTGAVTQARAANMDEIITQALIDGQVEKALAFQDFRDRPTAQEAFDTALEYARSPADQQVISSIARGETPVREPDAGVIQRVGPRPDFLVQAYQDFQRRTQAGRAPTEEEAQQLTERAATGQSPQMDDLRMRLEKATLDNQIAREKHEMAMEQQSEAHQMKMESQRQKMQNDMEAFRQKMTVANGGGASSQGGATTTGETSGRTFQLNSAQLKRLEEQNIASGFHGSPEDARAYSQHLINIGKAEWSEGYDKPSYMTQGEEIDPGDTRIGGEDWGAVLQYNMEEMLAGQIDGIPLWAGADEMNKQIENYRDQGGDMRDVGIFLRQIHDEKARMKVKEKRDLDRATYIQDPDDIAAQLQAVKDTPRIDHANVQAVIAYNEAKEAADKAVATERAQKAADWAEGLSAPIRGEGARSISEMPSLATGSTTPKARGRTESQSYSAYNDDDDWFGSFADGGMTRGNQLELVGEEGPELVDLPPGSFVLPLKQLTHGQMLDLKRKGVPGYATGGIVFDDNQTQTATLPFGLRQMQSGRPITPSRGYLSQQAGLRLPSAQAFQNITPESREVFLDLAAQAGIPRKSFAQELALTVPSGRRLPVARIAPAQRRAIQ